MLFSIFPFQMQFLEDAIRPFTYIGSQDDLYVNLNNADVSSCSKFWYEWYALYCLPWNRHVVPCYIYKESLDIGTDWLRVWINRLIITYLMNVYSSFECWCNITTASGCINKILFVWLWVSCRCWRAHGPDFTKRLVLKVL